jgi:transcriptional regulator with XRE-family HTH domain
VPKLSIVARDRSRRFRLAFGERLKEERKRRNHTQAKLAAKLGIAADMLGRYERGLGFPSGLMLVVLAHELETSVDYLVTGRKLCGVADMRLLERVQALEKLPPEQLAKALGLIDVLLEDGDIEPRAPRGSL